MKRLRDAALAAEGHVVVRLTWERITEKGDAVLEEPRHVLAARWSAQ